MVIPVTWAYKPAGFGTPQHQNVAQCFATYLKAATGGKVGFIVYLPGVADPTGQPKLTLTCHECKRYLTVDAPTDTTIDYGVQEFVRLHAHNGEYDKEKKDLEQKLKDAYEENRIKRDIIREQVRQELLEEKAKVPPAPKTPEGRKFR